MREPEVVTSELFSGFFGLTTAPPYGGRLPTTLTVLGQIQRIHNEHPFSKSDTKTNIEKTCKSLRE